MMLLCSMQNEPIMKTQIKIGNVVGVLLKGDTTGTVVGIDRVSNLVKLSLIDSMNYRLFHNGDVAQQRGFVEIPMRWIIQK